MEFLDARRLTGPNLLARHPLVVVEMAGDPDAAVTTYLAELARMRSALGIGEQVTPIIRKHAKGVDIGYRVPVDVGLAHAEISEWAGLSAVSRLEIEPKRTEIAAMFEALASPRMIAIQAEARRRGLPFLWDDDEVSVGAGSGSVTWPRSALPETIDWEKVHAIPIVLVTGTNGKTTTTRLFARVVREAGIRCGNTSSDEITIDGKNVDTGDWTGPFAARTVLRRKDVDFAVLETARGGILRRGLAIDECDAALLTNVTEDHTGGYGIDDLDAMAQVKAVVAHAVRPGGTAVLNARDSRLVALGRTLPKAVMFGEDALPIPAAEIPITFGGAAAHNVENVLGVVALARVMGLPEEALLRALRGFKDNAGRAEVIEKNGVRVMLDFGHNPDGVRAILKLVDTLRGNGRLFVSAGAAGDRGELEVRAMSRIIADAKPDRVYVRELEGYLRGRQPGEMPAMFERFLADNGIAALRAPSEVESLRALLAEAAPGDFIVMLVHLEREAIKALLR